MSHRRSNVARLGTPDPVLVRYAGSNAAAPSVRYMVCLNGRVPEGYEVWRLNRDEVREVHLTARVKLFTLFDENNFRSTFYDSRRFRVPFIGCKGLNVSVEFIRYSDVTSDSTLHIISAQNIFVHSWGKYPTMIGPTCSNYNSRAYVLITCQEGFNKRCEHEIRRLLFVELERIAFQRHLAMVRDKMSHDVALNYFVPPVNNALSMNSAFNSPRPSLPNQIEFRVDCTFCLGFCTKWVSTYG